MKRTFDILCALTGLIILSPVMLAIAALIKIRDHGPIFFRQTRVGQHGQPFRIWKFRTMVPNPSQLGMPLTIGEDPRITPIGRWLRKLKLDELPQLINILLGEMSFVGPRPEVATYVDTYTDSQRSVLQFKPGLTDIASIHFINESELLGSTEDPENYYRNEIVPEKIRLNLEYARNATVWTDCDVILKTLNRLRKAS